jgi:MerR family redox-sensitive transcriptional activator SoxR
VLAELPSDRTATHEDWQRISAARSARLDERIATLTRLRDKLTGCIGCGCLSLDRCWPMNPDDEAGTTGAGRGSCCRRGGRT